MRQPASRRLILLALLVALGIGALFAQAIWAMRSHALRHAESTGANLAYALQQSIATLLRTLDPSLQGLAGDLANPQVMALSPDLRNRVLFDHSLRAEGLSAVLVLDAQGQRIFDSGGLGPGGTDFSDRDYFRAFQSGGRQGLFIGHLIRSRLTGRDCLPVSRAWFKQDGSFGGVVVGSIRLDYFHTLFAAVQIGPQSSLNLYQTNGALIARLPWAAGDVGRSVAGSENLARITASPSGTFTSRAVIDGVERLYAFQQVGDFPLVVNIGQSTDEILAGWRRHAALVGGFALLLMLACLGLAVLFVRELQQRQQLAGQLHQAERDLHTILDNLPSMVGYWDTEQRNRFVNQTTSAMFGRSPEAFRGLLAQEFLGEQDYAFVRPYLEQALQGRAQLFERTLTDANGQQRHMQVSYTPDRGSSNGLVRGIFVQMTDITERKRMEDEIFQEKELMRLTLQSIGDAVVCADAQGRITYLNPVAQRLTGWQAFDAAGCDVDEVAPLYLANGQQTQPSPLRVALATQAACGPTRGVVLHRKDGQRFEVEESACPIIDREHRLTGAVMVLHDVTETMAMAERMAHLAQYDALTDLPNRVLLQDRAQHALALARREAKGLGVMYLDLDGFKQINDALGHDAGDQLLVQFARRLVAAMRQSDTVCRQGGDEFVLLLPGLEDPRQAAAIAGKVLGVCQEPFVLNGQMLKMGLSAGLALFPQHGSDYEELARHADTALYAAKRGGRMQVRCYRGQAAEPEVLALPGSPAPVLQGT
ncbi:bifunctional diguanylate cyclase/phosphodiesterase [Simplicispira hankyongi]|uniref:Diguanylate cyclase n=1 Tax=Simplicispira hankyongi TaxID=2315688 RepID=A0A398C5J8_9BURK|nr:diguanylate cyclase [Simplicispira hankyongi]RID98262.1 diguanylate cyclase [Simplicispira hankyongi]